MSRSKVVSRVLCAMICLVVVVSIALSFINSQAISSITVTSLEENREPRDPGIMGVRQETTLPDYRLELIDGNNKTIDLGTIPNQLASAGLTWKCEEPTPRHMAASLRLIEEDPLAPDVVEDITLSGDEMEGENYRYQLRLGRSLRVGTVYFLLCTPVGWVLVGLFVLLSGILASNICVPN